MDIILASSSPYRKRLLATILPRFECISPNIDEKKLDGETPKEYVLRLSAEKARSIARSHQNKLIIASDQCGAIDNNILVKPESREDAIKQLSNLNNKQSAFYTGLCLLNSKSNIQQIACETTEVKFRALSQKQINAYLDAEQPYDCAGSFKAEGLGIALFEELTAKDPNTLIGLPLIRLTSMLANEGVDVLLNYKQYT